MIADFFPMLSTGWVKGKAATFPLIFVHIIKRPALDLPYEVKRSAGELGNERVCRLAPATFAFDAITCHQGITGHAVAEVVATIRRRTCLETEIVELRYRPRISEEIRI